MSQVKVLNTMIQVRVKLNKEVDIKPAPIQTATEKLGYYMASNLYSQLQKAKEKIKKSNIDRVYIIDGREGEGGKSTFAFQAAYSVDPTFDLSRVYFKPKEFKDGIRNSDRYKAHVFDESHIGLSSKSSTSRDNKELVQLLMEARQRNLFIFIVTPSIFLLEKYVAIFRSKGLFHCYCSKKEVSRRYIKCYNYQNKKLLYLLGKPLMDYSRPKIPKSYRFYAKFPPTIDRDAYEKKKLKAFKDDGTTEGDSYNRYEKKFIEHRNLAWYILIHKYKITQKELAVYYKRAGIPISNSLICRVLRDDPPKIEF